MMMTKDNTFLLPINVGRECEIQVHNNDHLQQCQRNAFNEWIRISFKDYSFTDDDDENRHSMLTMEKKNICCYRWALIDCLTESVRELCQYSANFNLRQYISKRDEVVLYYETFNCRAYPFGSLKCHLPTWLIVFIISLVLLLCISLGLLAIFNYRLHKRNKRRPVTEL